MIVLDTNALLRFFINDDGKKAILVKNLIENNNEIIVLDIVFLEIEFVLKKVYSLTKKDVLDAYEFLISNPKFIKSDYLNIALNIYKNNNLDFADCILVGSSIESKSEIFSFDEKLNRIKNSY